MKFLLDANLSPVIATYLEHAGHEAVHVRDIGLRDETDEVILEHAGDEGYVVISQDSDFTNLLAYRGVDRPSLVVLRGVQVVSAEEIAHLVLANLPQVAIALEAGAVVTLLRDRVRVRRLPIGGTKLQGRSAP